MTRADEDAPRTPTEPPCCWCYGSGEFVPGTPCSACGGSGIAKPLAPASPTCLTWRVGHRLGERRA